MHPYYNTKPALQATMQPCRLGVWWLSALCICFFTTDVALQHGGSGCLLSAMTLMHVSESLLIHTEQRQPPRTSPGVELRFGIDDWGCFRFALEFNGGVEGIPVWNLWSSWSVVNHVTPQSPSHRFMVYRISVEKNPISDRAKLSLLHSNWLSIAQLWLSKLVTKL